MLVTILLLNVVGCSKVTDGKAQGRHAVKMLMDSAEAVMNDNPEYSFLLMDSIDSHSISSRALQARYALLYTEAQYKNYIDETNDSLIMIAVRYYTGANRPELLFRSFYCLGCIYLASGQLSDAAVSLGQAEELADKIDDDYRLGLLFVQLGNVFFKTYDFSQALYYYRLAYDKYTSAKKDTHRFFVLYDIGRCLIELKDYSSAFSIMKEVQKWAEDNNQIGLMANCLLNKLTCSIHINDIENAQLEVEKYNSICCEPINDVGALSKLARYYLLLEDYPSASSMLEKAWPLANSSDSVNLLYIQSLLLEKTGQTDDAIFFYKKSIERQNNILSIVLKQPILGAQKNYFKSISEIESMRASHNRNVIILLSTIFILLIVVARVVSHSRSIKIESEKQGYLLTIKELRLKEDSNNEVINKLNNRVNALFGKQYAELDEIFDRMIELDIAFPQDYVNTQLGEQELNKKYYKKLTLFHKRIHSKFDEIKSPKKQKELDRIINDAYDNIMIRLSDKKLKLSNNDLLILRLLICGFSPKVVSYLVSEQQKTIYQKRARILKRIERESEQLPPYLYKILRIK